MTRENYRIFSPGRIAGMELANRLVRSATWDPCLFADYRMSAEVLARVPGDALRFELPEAFSGADARSLGRWLAGYARRAGNHAIYLFPAVRRHRPRPAARRPPRARWTSRPRRCRSRATPRPGASGTGPSSSAACNSSSCSGVGKKSGLVFFLVQRSVCFISPPPQLPKDLHASRSWI